MQNFKTYFAISVSMLIWSFSFIWTRMALVSFGPVALVTFRLVIATFLMFLIAQLSRKFQRIRRVDLKWFLLLAFFEPFMYYIGETYGLMLVESTLAAVIIATIPLFAPVLAFLLLKEKITKANVLGIIVSLSGVFMVIWQPVGGINANPWGVLLLFLAVISAIAYTTTLRKISTYYSTFNVIFYQSLFGLLYFVPTFLLTDFDTLSLNNVTGRSLTALIMLAVFASVIAFVLFAGVVRKIGVARTNVFVNLIPVFTAVLAWWLLGENLNTIKTVGITITVAGLFVSQLSGFRIKQIKGIEY